MKQEDKELLLKDLCARLPYGVKCKVSYNSGVINDADATLYGINKDGFLMFDEIGGDYREFLCKPYLFPLSNMTEEQRKEYYAMVKYNITSNDNAKLMDWLNKNRFDYLGLIEKRLAINATNLNIY